MMVTVPILITETAAQVVMVILKVTVMAVAMVVHDLPSGAALGSEVMVMVMAMANLVMVMVARSNGVPILKKTLCCTAWVMLSVM